MENSNDKTMRPFTRRNFIQAVVVSAVLTTDSGAGNAATASFTLTLKGLSDPTSATFSIASKIIAKVYVEYGYAPEKYGFKSAILSMRPNAIRTVKLANLKPGSKIYYRLRYLKQGSSTYLALPSSSIALTQADGNAVFAVQADPHMDENSSAEVYSATLAQIAKSAPAFLIDLGDIFMVDKLADKSEANIRARYELMKGYYQQLQGVPLKIVLGNHDGELGYSTFNTKKYRAEYFPEQTGEVSYFSFEGPDQLHVCLDPFTYTTSAPKADGWQWTLGKAQYDWLRSTLESSSATHKFVYIHHLLVGDPQSRGGVEIARKNEWGGANTDGTPGFAQNRPGWYKPVHDLLLENKVSFVFKGHDHLYVKQELDGIVYQTLPQPSHPGDKVDPTQYGYASGKTVGGSGFLRVSTAGKTIKVEFVKFDGTIADSYEKLVS